MSLRKKISTYLKIEKCVGNFLLSIKKYNFSRQGIKTQKNLRKEEAEKVSQGESEGKTINIIKEVIHVLFIISFMIIVGVLKMFTNTNLVIHILIIIGK